MNKHQMGTIGTQVRKTRGHCLDTSKMLGSIVADYTATEARAIVGVIQTVPFPSIRGKKEGPCPVYPDRPYYDARFHEGIE